MLLTCFWVVMWLLSGATSLSIGTPAFWALLFALIVDIFFYGYVRRQPWYIK